MNTQRNRFTRSRMKRWKRESKPIAYKHAHQYWVVRQCLIHAIKSAVEQVCAKLTNIQFLGIADKKR